MNILIPNATSPKNIGDQAMLMSLIFLLRKSNPEAKITIHSADPALYKKNSNRVRHTLYSWAVFADTRFFVRLIRMSEILLAYTNVSIFDRQLRALINDYLRADLIVFVGGGYLRSKKGITQCLNLLMQLVMFMFAKQTAAKTIVAPISFGPFGYDWQEKLVAWALRNQSSVFSRESISYARMKKNRISNLHLSHDHAFLIKPLQKKSSKNTSPRPVIGFTIRNWLDGIRDERIGQAYIQALSRFSKKTGALVRPIIQVNAPNYGEDDSVATNFVYRQLKRFGVPTLPVKKIGDVRDGQREYGSLDILLGMRMHSNILAAVEGVPFVAVSYEHKTEGIARQINMENYCISAKTVDQDNLYKLLVNVYRNRKDIKSHLTVSVRSLRRQTLGQWRSLL